MQQKIVHLPAAVNKVLVRERPTKVWTLLDSGVLAAQEGKHIIPVHLENAFLEDYTHDWKWRNGVLTYYSRLRDLEDECWLLLEY